MTPEEKEQYIGIALRACGWNIDQRGVMLMMKILARIEEKGGEMSLHDIADIQVKVETYFESIKAQPK